VLAGGKFEGQQVDGAGEHFPLAQVGLTGGLEDEARADEGEVHVSVVTAAVLNIESATPPAIRPVPTADLTVRMVSMLLPAAVLADGEHIRRAGRSAPSMG